MKARSERVIAAPRERVWEVVGDPWHEPRWWPGVQRVEGVTKRGWTSVMLSKRGNTVRLDWSVEHNKRPTSRRWAQELEGSAFSRLFDYRAVEVRLEARGPGETHVALEMEQEVRGWARFAPWMMRRAIRRQLSGALDGLSIALEDGS